MTVEIHPIGLRCNLACTYCYQENMRPTDRAYIKVDRILKQVKNQSQKFTVFGGEALLTPIAVLEEFFRFGYENYKENGVQTNGTLLTQAHMDMFKKYNVHVGVSCDGPGELSTARESRSGPQYTKATTLQTTEAIDKLLAAGIRCSLIITLHADNARGDRLDRLVEWLTDLASKGLRSARLHLMELDNPEKSARLVLTPEENAAAILRLSSIKGISFDMLDEMRRNLLNDFSRSSCVWHGCDPYTTPAVVGIDADGTLSNCGRVNKGGINYRKSDTPGRERLVGLYRTPYREGGCGGCRFFIACKGQCPGTGEGGDWRNRTSHCGTLLILFEKLEQDLLMEGKKPVSQWENREDLERAIVEPVTSAHGDVHEDWHADVPHEDVWHVPVGRPDDENAVG